MKVITIGLNVTEFEYFVKHLSLLNIILPINLTTREIEVLAAFISQDKKLIEEDMFNGVVRKKVMTKLNLKPGGLGNHLKTLIDKRVLKKNELTKRITINPKMMPEDNGQGYRIKLNKNELPKE